MATKLRNAYQMAKIGKAVMKRGKKSTAKKVLATGFQLLPGGKLSKIGLVWTVTKVALKAVALWNMKKNPPPPLVSELRAAGKKRERLPRKPRTA